MQRVLRARGSTARIQTNPRRRHSGTIGGWVPPSNVLLAPARECSREHPRGWLEGPCVSSWVVCGRCELTFASHATRGGGLGIVGLLWGVALVMGRLQGWGGWERALPPLMP